MQAMPMMVFGFAALVWIIVRAVLLRHVDGQAGAAARRDLWVGLPVAASWFAIWGLYCAYTWTTDPTNVTRPGRQVLCPGDGCDLAARRVAGDEDSGSSLARPG